MRAVLAISRATILECIRDRVLYSVVLFALGLILASTFLSAVPIGNQRSILVDFGYAGVSFLGLSLSILLGIALVSKEIERKSLYWLLVKPLSRPQLLIGKYLGLVAVLLLDLQFMALTFVLLFRVSYDQWLGSFFTGVAFLFLKFAVLTAIAVCFSTFSTPILSIIYTLVVYFIGLSTAQFRVFAPRGGLVAAFLGEVFYYLLPNFDNFDVRKELLTHAALPAEQVLMAALYAAAYIALAFSIALYIFDRREFK
ncbi:MAG: ABC transporter permease subunit [Planctomycetes bacterium]|nr:ABC transporter permease subunit [Planctomycetota bacterium]